MPGNDLAATSISRRISPGGPLTTPGKGDTQVLTSRALAVTVSPLACVVTLLAAPPAQADNSRLNNSVVADVYTVQHHAGCTNDIRVDPRLRLAAQWHAVDVLNNRALDGDLGSDG